MSSENFKINMKFISYRDSIADGAGGINSYSPPHASCRLGIGDGAPCQTMSEIDGLYGYRFVLYLWFWILLDA